VSTASDAWPTQWLRAVLELCVLALVTAEETYGYAIGQNLEAAGFGRVKGGTLYPILLRLEEDGLVESDWREGQGGPGRKFYRATDAGRVELDRRRRLWAEFTGTTDKVLHHTGRDGT